MIVLRVVTHGSNAANPDKPAHETLRACPTPPDPAGQHNARHVCSSELCLRAPVVAVPVTISAFRMARQAMGMMSGEGIEKIEYEMKGKLSRGGMSTMRFITKGQFDLPAATANRP
jgi:hypothetical protein